MSSFKNLLLGTVLLAGAAAAPPAGAQAPVTPDEEATLRAAALASVEAFRAGGMDGMASAVERCYATAAVAPPDAGPWRACVGMDMAASYIDLGTAQLNRAPTDARFRYQLVLTRVGEALRRAGEADTPEGTDRYLDARWGAIYQGTEDAAERVYPTAARAGFRITSRRAPGREGGRG